MKRHFIRRPVIASTEQSLYSLEVTNGSQAKKEIEKALKAGTNYGDVNDYLNELYNKGRINDEELSELVDYTNQAFVGRSETAIQGATAADGRITSGFSFDFVWDADYDAQEIESAIFKVFEDEFNLEVKGIDFHSVNYADINAYAGMNVSQCGVNFLHDGDYPADDITTALDEELTSLGYELIGYDFYSL